MTTSIWQQNVSVALLTEIHRGTAVEHLGIEFLEVGSDFVRARVPEAPRLIGPPRGGGQAALTAAASRP